MKKNHKKISIPRFGATKSQGIRNFYAEVFQVSNCIWQNKIFSARKRVLSFFLILSMILSLSAPIFAENITESDDLQNYISAEEQVVAEMERKIIAYFVEWGDKASHQNYTVDKIPWDKVTHINYAFAKVNEETNQIDFCDRKAAVEKEYPGQLMNLPYKGHFNLLTSYKMKYPKVKTLISVGGWADTRGFYSMTDTQKGRETFADSCVAFIRAYGFDGVDIDYEYPTSTSQAGNPNDFDVSESRRGKLYANYDDMMKILREKLDAAGKEDGRKYLLTAAIPASSWILGGMETGSALKYLDFANLMTYDFHGAWNGFVGHNSPLYPDARDPETKGFAMPVLNIDWAVRYFRGALPAEKINIGVPYYTRGWKDVTKGSLPGGLYGSAAKTGGGATGEDNYWGDVDANGKEIPGGSNPLWHVKNLLKKSDYALFFDDVCKVPYVWNDSKKVFLTFENEASVAHKADYVINKNLGGVIIWEIDGDYDEGKSGEYEVGDTLTTTIKNKFDAAPALKPTPLPEMPPTAKYTVDFSGKYDHPNYTFAMTIHNNTGKEIPKGWELEFDMPKSCYFTSIWGATLSELTERGDFNHYRVRGPSWQGIPSGGKVTLQGMIKLNFSKGPQNFILNGLSSETEYPDGTPGGDNPPTSELKKAVLVLKEGNQKSSYKVQWTVPAESGALRYELFENDWVLKSASLDPKNIAEIIMEAEISNKAAGEYRYYCQLYSENASTQSNTVIAKIEDEVPPQPETDWLPNKSYAKGAQATYAGKLYECLQPHTSLIGWEPPNAQSLWRIVPKAALAEKEPMMLVTGSAVDAISEEQVVSQEAIQVEASLKGENPVEQEDGKVFEPTISESNAINRSISFYDELSEVEAEIKNQGSDLLNAKLEEDRERFLQGLDQQLEAERRMESPKGYIAFGSNTLIDQIIDKSAHPLYGAFKVVGYYPSWTFSDVNKVPYDRLTHINYSFLLPKSDGSVKAIDNPQKLKDLVKKSHENKVKVSIAVGGWSDGGAELDPVFETLAANEVARNRLIDNIIQVVETYNLDGVDMDWEYPDPGQSAENYYLLMKGLKEKLAPKNKLLTAAVSCGRTVDGTDLWAANAITKQVVDLVDWLNIMAYDGGNGNRHSPYSFAEGALNYWQDKRGFSADKLVLGLPFYGRPSWKPYNQIVAENPQAPFQDNVGDVYYNGIDTIKRKTDLAKNRTAGIMIWEITQDTVDKTSLITAIAEKFGYKVPDNPTDPTNPEEPIVEPEEAIPPVPEIIPNQDLIQDESGIEYSYRITETATNYEVKLKLSNNSSSSEWNKSKIPVYGIQFYTDAQVLKFDGGQQLRTIKGGYIAEVKDWQKALAPNGKIEMTALLDKTGKQAKPYGFRIKLLRGEDIQVARAELPKSFIKNNKNLSYKDLVEDENTYYETKVKPCEDQLMLYKPTHPTQIRFGQAESVFVNGYTGVKIMMPSKYAAMALGYNQEIYGINPHYMAALGSKENFAFAFQKESQGDFTKAVSMPDGIWYWGMKAHNDGPFQQEVGNFAEMINFYPDYFEANAKHSEFVSTSNDPADEKFITAALCSANSVMMTRDFISAIPTWRFNAFVKYARDDKAEISLITFIYNRGINAVSKEVFTNKRSENLNAANIMLKNGYLGYGNHVPQIMGMVEKMNAETLDIYDADLSLQDIEVFFKHIRPFYRVMSDIEWQLMMGDVEQAFQILAQHQGKQTISYRYDFLTLLRVAKAHLPEPQPAAPMGENFSYQIANKNK